MENYMCHSRRHELSQRKIRALADGANLSDGTYQTARNPSNGTKFMRRQEIYQTARINHTARNLTRSTCATVLTARGCTSHYVLWQTARIRHEIHHNAVIDPSQRASRTGDLCEEHCSLSTMLLACRSIYLQCSSACSLSITHSHSVCIIRLTLLLQLASAKPRTS